VTDIVITPHGRSWAVKHNGGFLGYAQSQSQAIILAQGLVDWIKDQGRGAAMVIEETSSEPAGDRSEVEATALTPRWRRHQSCTAVTA